MPDKDASTPRLFLIRHGETEWSRSGRFTGTTDLPLTAHGIAQVESTGRMLVGPSKLLDPAKIARVFVSPRLRAQKTAQLLFPPREGQGGWGGGLETTEDLAEWDYGDYEGLLSGEIRRGRRERGWDREGEWDIWRDGCEGGESPEEVTRRVDRLVGEIREMQRPAMGGGGAADVVLIAHGHILRAFTKRWLRYPMGFPLSMMLEPGGVGILSYQHQNIDEPAFLLGMGFPVVGEAASCLAHFDRYSQVKHLVHNETDTWLIWPFLPHVKL